MRHKIEWDAEIIAPLILIICIIIMLVVSIIKLANTDRDGAISFECAAKGYYCCGETHNNTIHYKDLNSYEY